MDDKFIERYDNSDLVKSHKQKTEISKSVIDANLEEMLRGTHAIAPIRDQLDAAGFRVPEDYRFRAMDKTALSIANSAVFELIGGVPNYMLWAHQNPGKFYELLHKMDVAPQVGVNVMGNTVQIVSPMGASPLDDIEMDSLGRVVGDDGDMTL